MQQAGVTSEQVQAAYDKSAGRSQDYAERAANRQVLGANQNVRATEKSGNELLAGIGARGARLIGGMRADEADILGGLLADEADILKGYGDRYTFTEGELKGFGDQMKSDVNRSFDESDAAITQDLQSRGILSSTEAASDFSGNRERRTAEQRRLGEQLIQNRIGLLGGIMGERSSAQERLSGNRSLARERLSGNRNATQAGLDQNFGAYDAATRGELLDARRGLSDARTNAYTNLSNWFGTDALNRANLAGSGGDRLLNTIMGINRVPPASNAGLLQQFGANSVQGPQSQSNWYDFLLPQVAGGAAGAGTAAGLGALFGGGGGGFGLGWLSFLSDRNAKENFGSVDDEGVASMLTKLSPQTWSYKGDAATHIGPMAQDFQEVTGFGDGRSIPMVDAFGLLLSGLRAALRKIAVLESRVGA